MAGFDSAASLSGGSKARQSLDRDTLIEAAQAALEQPFKVDDDEGWDYSDAVSVIDAVLPLIADVIEQERISEGWDGPFGAFDSAYNDGVTDSARLVRGLAGGSGE